MEPPGFDAQADRFDRRAGLHHHVARSVAAAVAATGQLEPGDLLLEVGAGTGEIGIELARVVPRYRGFDRSGPMLDRFRQRVGGNPGSTDHIELVRSDIELVRADAEGRWPAADGEVRAIFGSRVFHRLPTEHVVREIVRISSRRGATLLIGGVRRSPESVGLRMRERMRALLVDAGIQGTDKPRVTERLVQQCAARGTARGAARGAERITAQPVARWSVWRSPRQSLDAWAQAPGLAGHDVPATLKQEILSRLGAWAKDEFGAIDRPQRSEEEYVIEGIRWPMDLR